MSNLVYCIHFVISSIVANLIISATLFEVQQMESLSEWWTQLETYIQELFQYREVYNQV